MIFEHEIPKGSRLYFGSSAKRKRVLENHTDITLITVDIEIEEETTLKYNIRSLPTLVFIKDNIEVGRTSGVLTADMIENKIKELYA